MHNTLDKSLIPDSLMPFASALEGRPDYARRMARLCSDLSGKVEIEALTRLAIEVRKLAPNDQIVLQYTGNVIDKSMPGWHFGCLEDLSRNEAYRQALNNLVDQNTLVLDVGAGCGVLSLFAAAAGAKHVYAVEIEKTAAKIAREIVRINGFEDRITVIEKDILDVKLGEDIPVKCNLVVQDIIWPRPFSRNIHKFLNHCQEELLTDDALFCPETIRMIAALSDADEHIAWPDYGDYLGFDLSPLNILTSSKPEYVRPHPPTALLSDAFVLTTFDLRALDNIKDHDWDLKVSVTKDGQVHHLLQWLEFEFPDGTLLQNGPEDLSVRALSVRRFFDPIKVRKGQEITLKNNLVDGVVETNI